MNVFIRIGKFLSRCYNEIIHMYWPSLYDLELYCALVILFVLSLCTLTFFIDFVIKYSLDYIYN